MLNDLEALEVFASLCTTGSIQKTAQALGIDSPTASRKLTKLETQLGRQLINREKRPFEMTASVGVIPISNILFFYPGGTRHYAQRMANSLSLSALSEGIAVSAIIRFHLWD